MKKGVKMAKATRFEVKKRVNKIYDLLIRGKSADYILQFCSENWNVCERQAYNYIKRAIKKLEKIAETEHRVELGKAIARLSDLYDKEYTSKNWQGCRQVQKDLNTLLGLEKPTEVDVSLNYSKQIEEEKKRYGFD